MGVIDVIVKLGIDRAGYDRSLDDADERLRRVADKVGTVGLAAVTALTALSLKSAVDFENAFAGVQKTVNGTTAELAGLERGIRDMALVVPVGTREISAVAEAAGQLGIQTGSILDFTRTMVDLGVSTNLSAEQAATSLARLANITQLQQDKFDELGSTVVALGNNFATTEAEIVEMALRLAGTGSQIGLTQAEILGLAAALSSVGINAEEGGSSFSIVLQTMRHAVDLSTEKLEVFARTAGVTVGEFSTLFKRDASEAITLFIEGLHRMEQRGEVSAVVLDELGLSNIRTTRALNNLGGAADLTRNAFTLANQAWEDNNALTDEARKRYETMGSRLILLKNAFMENAITIGESLQPAFSLMLDGASSAIRIFGELPVGLQVTAIGIAGVSAASLKLAANWTDIVKGGAAMGTSLVNLATKTGVLAAAQAVLAATSAGLLITLGVVAAAGVAAVLVWQNWDKVSAALSTTLQVVGDSIETVARFLGVYEVAAKAAEFATGLVRATMDVFAKSLEGIHALGTGAIDIVASLGSGMGALSDRLGVTSGAMALASVTADGATAAWGFLADRWNDSVAASFDLQNAVGGVTISHAEQSEEISRALRLNDNLQQSLRITADHEKTLAEVVNTTRTALDGQREVTREKNETTEEFRKRIEQAAGMEGKLGEVVTDTTRSIQRQSDGTIVARDAKGQLVKALQEVDGALQDVTDAWAAEHETMTAGTRALGDRTGAVAGLTTAMSIYRDMQRKIQDESIAKETASGAGFNVFDLGNGFHGMVTSEGNFSGVTGGQYTSQNQGQNLTMADVARESGQSIGQIRESLDRQFGNLIRYGTTYAPGERPEGGGGPSGPPPPPPPTGLPPSHGTHLGDLAGWGIYQNGGGSINGQAYANVFAARLNANHWEYGGIMNGGAPSALAGLLGVPAIQGFIESRGLRYFARGGVTTGPTRAVLGDNPSGQEAVLPLDDPKARELLRDAAGGSNRGPMIYIHQVVVKDGRDFDRMLASYGVKRRMLG